MKNINNNYTQIKSRNYGKSDKMKNNKLLLLVCLLLVGALMVGCGKKDTDAADNADMAMEEELEGTVQETEEMPVEEEMDVEEIVALEEPDEETVIEEETEETEEDRQEAEEANSSKDSDNNKSSDKSATKNTNKSASKPKENKKATKKKTETPKETSPAPKPTPDPEPEESTPTPEPEEEEPKKEEPKESESEKKGLLALTPKELKAMLDEEFPGDNIPQWWIDTHCGEKLYEYTWGKYGSKGMNHFYRTAERVINEDTIECDITITLDDDSMRFHKIRLRVDDNGVWSVISDKIVD